MNLSIAAAHQYGLMARQLARGLGAKRQANALSEGRETPSSDAAQQEHCS
jgi:hypothetical protein